MSTDFGKVTQAGGIGKIAPSPVLSRNETDGTQRSVINWRQSVV